MDVIIYNINSFGGNYEYSKYLFKAYKSNDNIQHAHLIMPSNAEIDGDQVVKLLLPDLIKSKNKWLRKIHYLYRSIVNPYKLFFYLKKRSPSIVIFNDFDQITAWLWAPIFKFLKAKHKFAVILHDPDRDKFFPVKWASESSMESIMDFMDIAFYHGFLPKKPYYKGDMIMVDVPHGIYDQVEVDQTMVDRIKKQADGQNIIGVLGNIRDEKNYHVIIEALSLISNVKLLVAGKAANSGVSTDVYKQYAATLNVGDRIIWNEGYLTNKGFNASIVACDIVLLFYKPSFTSQSGVLNTIAPFKKKLIISDAESSLKRSVEKYGLGRVVDHRDSRQLSLTVKELLSLAPDHASDAWDNYIKDSSWGSHVTIALEAINNIK